MTVATKQLARDIRSRWRGGEQPNALAALQGYPDLASDPSAVLDLAYEEYCLRRARGETIDREAFCAGFSHCRSALRQILSVDQLIGHNPTLLDEQDPDTWPIPGEELCGFVILRDLGIGAFARVYLARQVDAGDRPVVLKVSKLASHEPHTLGKLDHDHIVRLHSPYRDPVSGRHILCMPFIGAATLTDVLDRLSSGENQRRPTRSEAILEAIAATVLPGDPAPSEKVRGPSLRGLSFEAAAARLGQSLAATLAYLHGKGLYHSDLKPSNVLLSPEGQPLLLDFNLSRGTSELGGLVGGTFPYMAPEHLQAFIDGKERTTEHAASDVFSLGVMLYELLTGTHPFGAPQGETRLEAARSMQQLQTAGFVPIRERNPDISPAFAALVERCLSNSVKARPDAAHLAAALRPRRVWPVFAGALALAVIVGVLLFAWAAMPTGPDARIARENALRHLANGEKLLAKGQKGAARRELLSAGDAFNAAIEARKAQGNKLGDQSDYYHGGRVQMLLKDWTQAERLLAQARKMHREQKFADDPLLRAYLSRCYLGLNKQPLAILQGEAALEAGYRPAWLLNDVAYCLLQQGRKLEQIDHYLAEALRLEPDLVPAHANRIRLVSRQLQNSQEAIKLPALTNIEAACECFARKNLTEPPDLAKLIALLYARAVGKADKQLAEVYRQKALRYVHRACQGGAGYKWAANNAVLKRELGGQAVHPKTLAKKAPRKKTDQTDVSFFVAEPPIQ